ncbi:ATP-binding protein [Clostridium neuense]|uniref:histidine kinase n=1 Tax=Clostridium neuense TaxID=1728934 RepID=A0ABW8TAS8_9CLOT
MSNIFKNEEVKSITIKFLIIQIVVLLGWYVLLNAGISGLNKKYISSNKVICARILKNHPEEKEQIVKVFTQGPSSTEIKESNDILNDYGYTYELEAYKNPLIIEFKNKTVLMGILFLSLTVFILYFLAFNALKGMFKKIREVYKASEALVEGNFNVNFPENGEGDFYILGHEFNVMAKRLKESLSNLKNDKTQLKNIISDISHQLKTPLAALIMYNDIMLNDNEMKWEDRKNFLQRSTEQLNRMEWLVINLLKMARLEAGAVEFHIKNEKLLTTVKNALKPLIYKLKEKKQNLILNVDDSIKIKHDSKWMAESISNIVKNSIEHTGEAGTIEISAEETPLSVQISIKDNGEGISEKNINKIFKRFYKGENSTNPESIGIGLALTKQIVESQGGSIMVSSKVGVETEFKITFLKTII